MASVGGEAVSWNTELNPIVREYEAAHYGPPRSPAHLHGDWAALDYKPQGFSRGRTKEMTESNAVVTTAPVVEEQIAAPPAKIVHDMFNESALEGIKLARRLVLEMTKAANGPGMIARIQGKNYPTVQWWTTAGAALGIFGREISSVKLDRDDGEVIYEAVVETWRGDQMISRASALCSSKERTWSSRDEYAIKSMACTRALGKAFRLPLSSLAVMAGLEATPAEEMPADLDRLRGWQGGAVRAAPEPAAAAPKKKPVVSGIADRRKKMIDLFSQAGVEVDALLGHLKLSRVVEIKLPQIEGLLPIFRDLKAGKIDPSQIGEIFFSELPVHEATDDPSEKLISRFMEKHDVGREVATHSLSSFATTVFAKALGELGPSQAEEMMTYVEAEDINP